SPDTNCVTRTNGCTQSPGRSATRTTRPRPDKRTPTCRRLPRQPAERARTAAQRLSAEIRCGAGDTPAAVRYLPKPGGQSPGHLGSSSAAPVPRRISAAPWPRIGPQPRPWRAEIPRPLPANSFRLETMVPTTHLLAFALTCLVIIAVPGPSVLFTVSRALTVG